MGKIEFSLLLSKNGKSETRTYKCERTKQRWSKYYLDKGFKVTS